MKRVLVTGASGGIGRAVAEWFHQPAVKEFSVTAHHHTSPPPFSPWSWSCDLTLPHEVAEMITRVSPDILINCAGVQHSGRVLNLDYAYWLESLSVNLTAPFLLTRFALPDMIERGYGRIIHLSSLAARYPTPGSSAYAASKAGLEGFIRSAATEVAHKGVTINAVAPGLIDAGMGAALPEAAQEHLLSRTPAKHPGTVDDVVGAIRYLIDAPHVTGQTIRVDGGMW